MRLAQPQSGSQGTAVHGSSSSAYHALQPVRATPHARAAWVAKVCYCYTATLLTSVVFDPFLQTQQCMLSWEAFDSSQLAAAHSPLEYSPSAPLRAGSGRTTLMDAWVKRTVREGLTIPGSACFLQKIALLSPGERKL